MLTKIKNLVITPKSKKEDSKRQEMILNVILVISIACFFVFEIIMIINSIIKGINYDGVSPTVFGLILIFYIILLALSRLGYYKNVSYILVSCYVAGALYCGYQWGVSLPATLLTTILAIQISSILIGTKFSIKIAIVSIISLVLLGIHEYSDPSILQWRFEPINKTDFITYSFILAFITLLSWLSNREIEKSLTRARESEAELIKEKQLLEIKVEERTKEIREFQIKRIEELSRVAEFGRLAQGLFHDLISPLSSMTLHMGKLKTLTPEEIEDSNASIEKIVSVSQRLTRYIDSVKYTIKESMDDKICIIDDEIERTISVLSYKAKANNVNIIFKHKSGVCWYGNPIKLHQIFLNVILNAIDACFEINRNNGEVEINTYRNNDYLSISIKDNGVGIESNLIEKIFDPFYTTKSPDTGTGIGLSTVKKIIDELDGKIKVKSIKNMGSVFTIEIPIIK